MTYLESIRSLQRALSLLRELSAEVAEAFRRQWWRGVIAGLGLAVLLYLLAYLTMDP